MRMTRANAALAAVIVAALLPAAGIFLNVAANPAILRRQDDPMSTFERRVAPLRDVLSSERVVGYLAPAQIADRTAHFYSVRYALAPVQVLDEVDLPLVVADGVTDPQHLPSQLRVRRDFGDGLLLLERVQ